MRETVLSTSSATQVAPAPTAIPAGSLPTSTFALDAPERASIRATVALPVAAHTDPAPTATGLGIRARAQRLSPRWTASRPPCRRPGSMRVAVARARPSSRPRRARGAARRRSPRSTASSHRRGLRVDLRHRLVVEVRHPDASRPGGDVAWPRADRDRRTTALRAGSITATEFAATVTRASPPWPSSAITPATAAASERPRVPAATAHRRRRSRGDRRTGGRPPAGGTGFERGVLAQDRLVAARAAPGSARRPSSSTSTLRVSR